MEPMEDDELWEILDRQEFKCAGCNEPLTTIGALWGGESAASFNKGWNIEGEILRNEHEEPRIGLLRYKKARSLGGSRQELEDLEFMCEDCIGSVTRSVRLRRFLVVEAVDWLIDNDDVRSFNHLVGLAIKRYISTEDELPKEAQEKAKSVANDVIKELDKMIIEIDEMKEKLDRFTD
jgi:hypothetical protein